MNTKITTIIILLMSVTFSSCGQRESIADSFIEYDSTELITENNDLSDRIPVFSVKYPPGWGYAWVGDSGVIALLISSGDLEAAWLGQDYSGATMMIIPVPYSGEKLTELFYSTLDAGRAMEPSTTTIVNGQGAALAEYTRKGNLFIEAVIVRAKWALLIVSHFPTEKETEFRPLLEVMISTLEIK
jgi:hypothetical protein